MIRKLPFIRNRNKTDFHRGKNKKSRLSEKKVNFSPYFFQFLIFLNSNNNNFAIPEVGTVEGYILKAHTKFEVNQLNRTRDFVNQVEKSNFEKIAFKNFTFIFFI